MKYLIFSIVVLTAGFFGMLEPVRNVFQDVLAPVQYGLRKIAFELKDIHSFFVDMGQVRNENLGLLKRKSELESIILNLKRAEEENKILKAQLNVKNKDLFEMNFVLANVMGNPADLTGSTVYLDKGEKHGLKEGDNVIEGDFLVGIVKEASWERSLVMLLISPDVSATVYDIDSPDRTEGLAKGQYGSSVVMERVLPKERLETGDTIVTSGKDGFFRPGLLVGTVSSVSGDPAQPLKSAYVKTAVDFSELDRVFVILEK